MWPWRPPSTEHPLGGRGGLAEEGGEEKFLARRRQLRAARCIIIRGSPGCSGAGHGVCSQQPRSRGKAAGAGCRPGRPFCPRAPQPAPPGPLGSGSSGPGGERTGEHRPRPGKGRSAAAQTEPLAPGALRLPVSAPRSCAGRRGAGIGGRGHPHPAGSCWGSCWGFCREGAAAHVPPLSLRAERAAEEPGPGAARRPPRSRPAPASLLPATLPRNFPRFVLRLEMIYGSVLDRVSARRPEPGAETCDVPICPSVMDGNK